MSSAGNSNPDSLLPSSTFPLASQSLGGNTQNGKMRVIVEADGSVVGDYANVWNTRTGDFVRTHIPIIYTDWRRVPPNFKNDVWTALMGEFELNVPPEVARPVMEKSWSQKFRTYKNTLREVLNNDDPLGSVPKGVDPNHWKVFVGNEMDPKKQLQNKKNADNRKKLEYSHCLGRRTYAQKQYIMKQENPEKKFGRVDNWLLARERRDGTVLESAKTKYGEVMAAVNKRKSTSLTGEECSDTCRDLDNDELAEVFGKDNKGRVRAMGSHVTKKQLIHIGVATASFEQTIKAKEEASLHMKDNFYNRVNSRLNNFESFMHAAFSKSEHNKECAPQVVITPGSDVGCNYANRPHLSQHLDTVFATVGVSDPHPSSYPAKKTSVILCDKYGKDLAKGYVVMDDTAGVCHFKQVGHGEKKVYVEAVFDPDARLWDPPQGGHDTLSGYVQGGYLIWLDCWLKYL